MRQTYVEKEFRAETREFIHKMNSIIHEYMVQGFVLTVRQLYYQLVARGIIANTLQEYKRTAVIINDAKLAGMIDWEAIEDRTRDFVRRTRWSSGKQILESASASYHEDMWSNQDTRVFVIVEKEALVGVLEQVCREYDVPLLAARGYPSGSVLREFAVNDLQDAEQFGQQVAVLHLGDHDPSGIDMTRDLQVRLSLFAEFDVYVSRIALNMSQIEEHKPPENPAKVTDSRFTSYASQFGTSSWELDALSPTFLATLLAINISLFIDDDRWETRKQEVEAERERITRVARNW